jgi:hypothetical protein
VNRVSGANGVNWERSPKDGVRGVDLYSGACDRQLDSGGGRQGDSLPTYDNKVILLDYREKHYSKESISTFFIDRELPIEKVR